MSKEWIPVISTIVGPVSGALFGIIGIAIGSFLANRAERLRREETRKREEALFLDQLVRDQLEPVYSFISDYLEIASCLCSPKHPYQQKMIDRVPELNLISGNAYANLKSLSSKSLENRFTDFIDCTHHIVDVLERLERDETQLVSEVLRDIQLSAANMYTAIREFRLSVRREGRIPEAPGRKPE